MKVVVTLEHRFHRTPDGAIWTQSPFAYAFWTRYLEVFDRVDVVARVEDVPHISEQYRQADGEAVSFVPVPHYVGPAQYVRQARRVKRTVNQAVRSGDAVILRVSSTLANCLITRLRRSGHPYGVEVVSDPYDVFAPGSLRHPLRPLFRWWFPRQLRAQCQGSCAATYVTESALQRRYPPAELSWSNYCSDVELPECAFASAPREMDANRCEHRLVMVGSLSQLYKAPDVLIRAVALCAQQDVSVRLDVVGDGKYRSWLESLAEELGVHDRVRFLGRLPAGASVRNAVDQADIFVLPSHVEGLPRAMIEAMARGLPCIGSTVGGFPELLAASEMVPPGDAVALAGRIRELITDPHRMAALSRRNLARAQAYRNGELKPRRTQFYLAVREATTEWLASR